MTAANRKKTSFKIALGGIITALSLVLLLGTGLIPIATYALPGLAGALMIGAVLELGHKWAFLVYGATSLLCLLITPDREAALLFVLFFGHYPIVKSYLERIKHRVLEWMAKLAVFNLCVIACYALIYFVFNMQDVAASFGEFGRYGALIFLAAGNVVFVLYDYTLSALVRFYLAWVRPKLFARL